MIVVPFLLWWVKLRYEEIKEERKEFVKSIHQIINVRAVALERKLNTCEVAINAINENLKHRSEVAQIKYSVLKDRLEDLEKFAHIQHGFHLRHSRNLDKNDITTMTGGDDDVETQLF